jgi:transposase InsO family protein
MSSLSWARFRFSIVGPLLSSPPQRGELKSALRELAEKTWKHPVTDEPVVYAVVTIERWYYIARRANEDPVGALRRSIRRDAGTQETMTEPLRLALLGLYKVHRGWTVRLLYDNLAVLAEEDATIGAVPSYSTVLRFMRAHGLSRIRRTRNADRPGAQRAQERFDSREVRSYEAEYVGSLWHLDFHFSSLKVLTPEGVWVRPVCLAILDDRSRLACHVQWYLSETAEDLVHGVCQALQKRGLPRAQLTDNGSAMLADEVKAGFLRLGIIHETTLPYSPYQNGKQEVFWSVLEGRLMAMLEGVKDLTLALLNEATQAWVEMEYNRAVHSETDEKPIDRYIQGPDVLRPCPATEVLRDHFRQETVRTQRTSDGTVSLEGLRFEVPGRFRHLERVTLRYARWNLRWVHLVDERSGETLCQVYPQDKTDNADGRRRVLEPSILSEAPTSVESSEGMAPLLRKLLAQYASTGIPPAYIPRVTGKEAQA